MGPANRSAKTKGSRRKVTSALALLAAASALGSATFSSASSLPRGGSWWKRQEPSSIPAGESEAQILKLISADGPYATMTGSNANAIQSAVGMSGDVPSSVASVLAASATTDSAVSSLASAVQTPSAIVQAVEASPSASPADKVATDSLTPAQESQLAQVWGEVSGDSASNAGEVQSWTYDPGAYGCGFAGDSKDDVASATLCSVTAPVTVAATAAPTASASASEGRAEQVLPSAFGPVGPANARRNAAPRAAPTPDPNLARRQYPIDPAGFRPVVYDSTSYSNLFPIFTSYVSLPPPSTTIVNFGPTSNLNSSYIPYSGTKSGNGDAPANINNPNSPDLGWLDVQIGAVPYKNGDLIASIVWILATIALIPLLLIRLLRRSSLISHVLITVIIFMVLMLITFGVRAKLASNTPTTSMMNVEGIMLSLLLPLLIEPLLHLLGLYSQQSGRSTGVPQASLVLRILNLVVFILFIVGSAYYASWLDKWEKALKTTQTAQQLPGIVPPKITRIAPVVGSIVEIIVLLGAALLIPVARGDAGSMRPGGFIFLLMIFLFISTVYRLLQSLHATTRISAETGGNLNSNDLLPFFQGPSPNTTSTNHRVANGLSLAPQGMYGPNSYGIDWDQLQLTMASRNSPQTPLIFNLVYVLPMWLMVFGLFFAHAPGKKKDDEDGGDGDGNVAVAKA